MTLLISRALSWLGAHPSFVILVFWPLLTGSINLAWDDAAAYALTHPRFAAWKKLVQKWGLSPRGTILLLSKLLRLPPPPDPPSSGSVDVFLGEASPTNPPTSPTLTRGAARWALAASLIFSLCISPLLPACGASSPTPAQHLANLTDDAAYDAELAVCHDKAKYPAYADYEACAKIADAHHRKVTQ